MNQAFKDIYHQVWKEVFPTIEPMDVEKFKALFTFDISLPIKYQCSFTGEDVYCTQEYGYKRFMGDKTREQKMKEGNNLQDKIGIENLSQVLERAKNVAYFRGNKAINSDVVEESDNIYSSSYIYNSTFIQGATKLMFCRDMGPSEYMLASKNSKNSSFGIRVMDSDSISNSFEVSFSGKCSSSYFCHNCFDLRDCMFCFDIASKQYCIANMQFEKNEYTALKDKLTKEYFDQLESGGFRILADIR